MTIYRSAPGDYGHEESESACIELNDNDVAGFIDINEYTYAEVDEDDYMVRLWLQDLKHVPSIDDVELEVYVDFEESLELEEALEELGGYSRIRKFFGTSQRD